MGFLKFIRKIFKINLKNSEKNEENNIVSETKKRVEIYSLWDYLQFNEHTQAFHLASVIRFDEWVTMDEIRRRIFDIFQITYENERSLYPYLKTMVDVGLIENNNIGGKRRWRKKDLLVKIEKKVEKEKEIEKEEEISVKNQK